MDRIYHLRKKISGIFCNFAPAFEKCVYKNNESYTE